MNSINCIVPYHMTEPAKSLFLYTSLITSSLFGYDGDGLTNYAVHSVSVPGVFFQEETGRWFIESGEAAAKL